MSLEKLLAQKAALEARIAEQQEIEKRFEKAKQTVLKILESNPKIALAEPSVLKETFTATVQQIVAGI